MKTFTLHNGNCLDIMKTMESNSVDSIVTDPPYGLSFMGKKWDYDVPSQEIWEEALRVLKPGGYLLAFAGTRTQHRMAVRIEDAGFEIRDMIAWVYGSGFPKSLDISKAISKQTGIRLCTCNVPEPIKMINSIGGQNNGKQDTDINRRNKERVWNDDGFSTGTEMWSDRTDSSSLENQEQYSILQNETSASENGMFSMRERHTAEAERPSPFKESVLLERVREQPPENERHGDITIRSRLEGNSAKSQRTRQSMSSMRGESEKGVGSSSSSSVPFWREEYDGQSNMSMPDLSQQSRKTDGSDVVNDPIGNKNRKWDIDSKHLCPQCHNIKTDIGGTALKPALEPITVARKPLEEKTVAANVLKYGTGGINIDASRVDGPPPNPRNAPKKIIRGGKFHSDADAETEMHHYNPTSGRFPANLIHDGSEEVVSLFPNTKAGGSVSGKEQSKTGDENTNCYGEYDRVPWESYNDNGSAARFFYCAKTSKKDRNEGLDHLADKEWKNEGAAIPERGNRPFIPSKNNHPTVKPTDLMRYLVRMVTPKGGTVLDPFMGSGSTGKAAILENFKFVGIELGPEYMDIARARIEAADPSDYEDEQVVETTKETTNEVDNLFDF
jgi:DNA modification methylase